MQHDEVIWQVIRHNHCSYMSKIDTGIFCRNPYNVTGVCNRSSCPLANSRYATIRDHDGVFYLYMKTIERAHMPNKLWERVKLPRNYLKAMEIIDKHMMFWPKLLVHKMKQRLTKMTQMRIRMRKLALKTREKVMSVPRMQTKRDARRLEKAEKAALLDKRIEEELIERLKNRVYGDIYNFDQKRWNDFLEEHEIEETEEEPEIEYVDGIEEEEEDMEDFGKDAMTFADDDDDDDIDNDDDDDIDDDVDDDAVGMGEDDEDHKGADKAGRRVFGSTLRTDKDKHSSKSKKKSAVLVEVEHENGGKTKERKAVH